MLLQAGSGLVSPKTAGRLSRIARRPTPTAHWGEWPTTIFSLPRESGSLTQAKGFEDQHSKVQSEPVQKEGLYSLWILSSCQAPGDMLNIPTPAAWKTAHPFCPFMENNIFLGNCSIHQHLSKYPFPLDQCMKVMSNDKEGHN